MSDKPIAERLQVKAARRLAVLGASPEIDRKIGVRKARATAPEADVIVLFVPDKARLDSELPKTLKSMSRSTIFWLAYPKLTSKLAADLSRDVIHALAPKFGLDTVSQIAIDDDWSALRLKRIG